MVSGEVLDERHLTLLLRERFTIGSWQQLERLYPPAISRRPS